jgi:hypothetical protein
MAKAAIASRRYTSSPLMTAAILATRSGVARPPSGGADSGVAPSVDAQAAPDVVVAPEPDAAAVPPRPDAAPRPDTAADAASAQQPPDSPSVPPARTPDATRGSGCACSLHGLPGRSTAALPLILLSLLELQRRRRRNRK